MNMVKAIVILGILLVPYALIHISAQEEVKVEIAEGASKVDNGKFYVPAKITIPVGTTVVWKNFDDAPHTVTDGTIQSQWGTIFDSGVMRLDDVYKFTFNEPGTYNYLCALNPWMAGKVMVLPEGASEVEVSVTTDRTTYRPGDSVNVKGNVSPIVADQPVVIEVLNPTHAQFRTDTVTVKNDGIFDYDFKLIGDLALPGPYTVKVTYSDTSTESAFIVERPDKPDEKPPKLGSESDVADVRVAAKQVRDFLIIRVSNDDDSGTSVYSISIQVPDSVIQAFRGPRDWSNPDALSGEIRSSTLDEPIEPGKKAIFKLKVDTDEIVINWTAYDASDHALDQGDTRPLSHRK